MANIVLYENLLAYYPSRVRLMLLEKNIPYESKEIDIFKGENLNPDYMKINPKAGVPTLIHSHNGQKTILGDSYEIVRYLDNLGTPLGQGCDTSALKQLCHMFASWDGNLYAYFYAPDNERGILKRINASKLESTKLWAAIAGSMHPELVEAYENRIKAASTSPTKEQGESCAKDLQVLLAKAEHSLQTLEGDFVAGRAYSLADVLLTCILCRLAQISQLSQNLQNKPRLSQYFARMKERPSYQKCFRGTFGQRVPAVTVLPALLKTFA